MTPPRPADRPAQVVVLAKSPVPGRVKTRLTPPYTPQQAAGLAAAALADTLRAVAGAAVEHRRLVLDGEPDGRLHANLEVRPQCAGTLDVRIAHAMAGAWDDRRLPVLLVGMDTPQVTAADLDRAVDLLLAPGTDAVLGAAEDGGWWALGLRHPRPELVVGVPMSRDDTGARQLDWLRAAGLSVTPLATRRDVDRVDDAVAVAQEAPGTAFAAAVEGCSVGAA